MVNNKTCKSKQLQSVASKVKQQQQESNNEQKSKNSNNLKKLTRSTDHGETLKAATTTTITTNTETAAIVINRKTTKPNSDNDDNSSANVKLQQQKLPNNSSNSKSKNVNQQQKSIKNASNNSNNGNSNTKVTNIKPKTAKVAVKNTYHCIWPALEKSSTVIADKVVTDGNNNSQADGKTTPPSPTTKVGAILTAALTTPLCAKCCSKSSAAIVAECATAPILSPSSFNIFDNIFFNGNKQNHKSKSYHRHNQHFHNNNNDVNNNNKRYTGYYRSYSDRRNSFDRQFAERNKDFVPIAPPPKPVLSASNIAAVIADTDKLTIIEQLGKGRTSYPIMQCGTLDVPDSSYHQQRSTRMDVYQIDDGFHSDGGTETPPPSPSSGSSIASTSDHGSLESVDTGGAQRLAVLSFEQVRKLHQVMDEKVAIHGRGNFPTLEVTLKDLVNSVRRKLEADISSGGAGVIVKDIRLNGGAASHVLASEDQPYNDLDLIYAIEFSSSRHFDRVKAAVLNTLLDFLPEGVSKRRIMPCALKEAYVGKMVKVNNNNDGDRWSLISLGNSPGHKNVELKFVDTMRRQFEFSVDSFQIVLDSLLLFYDCAALPISENFYPTVVGESVYGDFQEALFHLQNKLISTRQPEEIRGGGLLKYCNLLVRNYKPVDPQRIKTLERYMCSRFFIDFPDINTQTVKLEAYLRNHFWGVDEEPLQYQYLMHLREVVEMSTVCLMGHERRQTLMLIQSLAAQVLYKEQQKHQHAHAQEQYHQQQVAEQQSQQQPQTIYVQHTSSPQSVSASTTTLCCNGEPQAQQQQQQTVQQQQPQTATATIPQTIQIQAGPPGLIYANGVYYAPVIPATICTCNSTWLST